MVRTSKGRAATKRGEDSMRWNARIAQTHHGVLRVQATPLAHDAEIKVGAHEALEATVEHTVSAAITDNPSELARVELALVVGRGGGRLVGGGLRVHLHVDTKTLELCHDLAQNGLHGRTQSWSLGTACLGIATPCRTRAARRACSVGWGRIGSRSSRSFSGFSGFLAIRLFALHDILEGNFVSHLWLSRL